MNDKIKILIAEHDPVDLELLHHQLRLGEIDYIAQTVQKEPDYVNALRDFMPDLILCDFTFPAFDGPTAFRLRENLAPDTPFIFVSGTIGEERSIELIKNGVTDYVLKESLFTLNTKVTRALKESRELQQKKKIIQEMIQSESRLARAQQIAHIGSWELNFSNNIVRLSDEACSIYGLPAGNNFQSFNTCLALIHPEDAAVVLDKVIQSRESLPDFSSNYRIIRSNGSVRHIYSESKLEFDSNGTPTGLYGIIQDITEAVLLEAKLVQERLSKQSEITAAVLTAQENERSAIGRELQENLNQILSVAKLHIEMAKKDEVNRQMLLERSTAYILNVITEIRKISKTLESPGKQVGLIGSIQNLIEDLVPVDPVKIQFKGKNIKEEHLGEKLKLTIFRIVQEQVNNILKHANATRAVISLSRKENEVTLLISDNGEGFDDLKGMPGVGIKNIRSRADLYNGKVTIISRPGKGCELKVALCMDRVYE